MATSSTCVRVILTGLVFLLPLVVGCQRKVGQPYLVTGTIDINKSLGVVPEEIESRGGRVDLLMTVRTSPNIGDVVAQRRWVGIKSDHQFGIGKGEDRVARVKAQADKVYVTALLDIYDRGGRRITRSYSGWTEKPVPIGREFLKLEIKHEYAKVDPKAVEGYPIGGWFSPSWAEEAPPPGGRPLNPGPRTYSGTVDVPLDVRYAFRQFVLYMMAGDDPESTRDFLLFARYDTPSFPINFSLNSNQTKDLKPISIEKPQFVVAILDFDGNLDTREDQARVWSKNRVDVGADDIQLLIDPRTMLEFLMKGRTGNHGASGTQPSTEPARTVVSGVVELDEAAKELASDKAVLWLTVRDAASDELMLMKRLPPNFPATFEITEKDTMSGGTARVAGPYRVRAILTAGDPSGTDPDVLRFTSEPIEKIGAEGIKLRLSKP